MIKFFRKIRQKLLSENNISKYLIYAIGEVFLVVIGILIALQANNWNIERNNAKQEISILLQLEKEYKENLREVEQKILLRNNISLSIITLFSYMEKGIDGISLDTIQKHKARTYINATFDGATGVTNVLLNSGKLNILKNEELKNHLTNWYGTIQKMIEEEQFLVNQHLPPYFEYVHQKYDNSKMGGHNYTNADLNTSFLIGKKNKANSNIISARNDIKEWSRFLNDKIISNYLMSIYSKTQLANQQSKGVVTKIEQILELIKQDLEK